MASAHGAGCMLLPILLGMSAISGEHRLHAIGSSEIAVHLLAITVHTLGYLILTGTIAWMLQVGAFRCCVRLG
jgi:hypothetical protein